MNTYHEEEYRGCTIRLEYDDDRQNPRTEWDNVGTMVCWHRRYNLGDEQPKCDPQEYLREIARNYCFKERRALEERFNTAQRRVEEWDYAWYRALNTVFEKREDEILARALKENFVVLPLYLYDHSGITMSTGRFSCPWDSGQVGFIYCALDKAKHEWASFKNGTGWDATSDNSHYEGKTLREWVAYYLEGEVKTYDAFLTGDVVGFVAEDWDGEQIDSCWGFFPDRDVPYGERFKDAIDQAKTAIDCHIEEYGETANLNEAEH